MYSFDGEYRRRPIQNLSGSTEVCDRDAIIRKAQIERQKRNELRIQNNGAIVLQSYTRSFIHRQRKKKLEREKFDEFLMENRSELSDDGKLTYLIRRILFFYSSKNRKDCDRLIDICQYMIRYPGSILEKAVNDSLWLHRIKKMLSLCLEQLTVPNASQAIPMRMIETFSSDSVVGKYVINTDRIRIYLEQIFRFLVERQYFKRIRMILDEKCPPLDGETLVAPNPTCEALYQMILRPLAITFRGFGSSPDICKSFAEHILSPELTCPIRYFVVPCLAQHPEFPFSQLISSLATTLLIGEEPMDVDNVDSEQKIKSIFTVFLLHELLVLDTEQITKQKKLNDLALMRNYTAIISEISSKVIQLPKSSLQLSSNVSAVVMAEDDSDSSDSEADDKNTQPVNKTSLSDIEIECLLEIIDALNSAERVSAIVESVGKFATDERILYNISNICHSLMVHNKNAVYDYKILYTLAFMPNFIRSLWFTLATQSKRLGFSSPLSWISKGVVPKHHRDIERTIPFLATFCAMFGRLVPTLHDAEFCEESMVDENIHPSNLMPFTIAEVVQLSKTLKEISMGLVDLAFPDTRSNLNEHYRNVTGRSSSEDEQIKQRKLIWSNLLKVVVSVLNQIYTRDLRRGFCPDGHWTVSTLNLPLDRPNDLPLTRGSRTRGIRPFQPIRDFTREDFENGPPMSMKQIRSITILREIPFIVAFSNRVSILQGLIAADKIRVQGDLQGFLQGPSINLSVRRTHLYEDAFDKLRPENEPDLRHKFRVQFFSSLGLEEAGIDGGGVFREFLSELIKSAFDPNRGFFMVTTDNKLYPNPTVADITPDFEKHYYFMGRILGKVIYENLLVELPLAEFFLTKLAGKYSDVDVHQLASLDPELYKNLLSLKEYDGDVSELGLDFTVVSNSLGQTQVTELKPNGQSIPVTSSNRIEYIQLNADYKLNKQIRAQCVAFRRGLSNVLPVEWLYMFSNKELQILLSGAEIPIDLEDLKKHCKYGGEYSPEHRSIMCFWKVLEGFTDLQKRQLLKFVTSCSRPPLLGFKDLDPPFFIQNTGDEERLPTASTCTNLLKLPPFKTEEQMREKLLYAIQSGAGFELS